MTSRMAEGAWAYVKRRALATVSAVLIYGGIVQIVSAIQYSIGNAIMWVINLVIENAFRDRMLLAAPPYSILGLRPSMARVIAIGVMVIVIGIFVSLLADLKGRPSV
jgi:hypothetical protein